MESLRNCCDVGATRSKTREVNILGGERKEWRWWKLDSTEDKILLNIVWMAEKLGRLPEMEEIPNTPQHPYVGQCKMYFGSVEAVLEQVAELLYGDKRLSGPTQLLPEEERFSKDEQERITRRRWLRYEETLRELHEPGALYRRREKHEARRRRRQRMVAIEGWKVEQLPMKEERTTKWVWGDRTLDATQKKKEKGPAKPKQSKQPPKTVEETGAEAPPRAEVAFTEEPPKKAKRRGGFPRTTKAYALEVLSKVKAEYGMFPTQKMLGEYGTAHRGEGAGTPAWETLKKLLGNDYRAWPAILEEYEKERDAGKLGDGKVVLERAGKEIDAADG